MATVMVMATVMAMERMVMATMKILIPTKAF